MNFKGHDVSPEKMNRATNKIYSLATEGAENTEEARVKRAKVKSADQSFAFSISVSSVPSVA
jgi:hypothetical protein